MNYNWQKQRYYIFNHFHKEEETSKDVQLSDIESLLGNTNLNLTTKDFLIFPNSCNQENTKRPSLYVNSLPQNLCGCDLSWDKHLLCTLKYSVSFGREDEFQPKININSTFRALAEGISGCSLIGSCLLVLAALLWLLTNGWRWYAWHFIANFRVLLLWASLHLLSSAYLCSFWGVGVLHWDYPSVFAGWGHK